MPNDKAVMEKVRTAPTRTAPTRTAPTSRREEYAAATRQAIVAAARRLFTERGYFATKVDEIAALARVAPATVYAVSGGKETLLRTMMDLSTTDPIVEKTLAYIDTLDQPEEILRVVASVSRQMRQEFGDIMRVMLATAPHDKAVAQSLATATTRYREALRRISQRLENLGGLREGLDVGQAVDVFWFYFGYWGMFVLLDDNGWSYDEAEKWLCEESSRALLRNPPPSTRPKALKARGR
jgi:AcrR family transcriptional regulator